MADPDLSRPALVDWLHAHVPGFKGPFTPHRFKGGQSNPTWRIAAASGDYVLRSKPVGADLLPGAHAMDREYRVISALHGAGFPVPRAYALSDDESVTGAQFYVMEMVNGRTFWDARFLDVPRAERAQYLDAMNKTIAELHGIDYAAIGLGDYGKPGNYFARQIGRWSKQYLADELAGRDANMDRLVEWLPGTIPPGDESAIVHGDFRCDNMIFAAHEPRVIAVLDWELSTLGHPLADFSYNAMMYRMPGDVHAGFAGEDLSALGLPSEADYVAAYARRTGRDGIPNLDWYMAFNFFRFAAIVHGVKGRALRGTASGAGAGDLAGKFEAVARLGWEQAEKAIRAG